MTRLNRRRFFQFLGATGAAATLPVAPLAQTTTAGGASVSKALWASIHARAASPDHFAVIAHKLGLPTRAIAGVGAKAAAGRALVVATGRAAPDQLNAAMRRIFGRVLDDDTPEPVLRTEDEEDAVSPHTPKPAPRLPDQ